MYTDATNDPNNPYDKGAPDWQSGDKKDLKFRTIIAGVRSLIKDKGWDESDVCLYAAARGSHPCARTPSPALPSVGAHSLITVGVLRVCARALQVD